MKDIHIKPELLSVLKDLELKNFTVAQLTNAYLQSPNTLHKKQKPARQYIYRNMLRMMSSGLMKRIPGDHGWPHYCLTDHFLKMMNPKSAKKTEKKATSAEETRKPITALKERLKKYKSDMLCALGEAAEYNELCVEHPELCDQAQILYNKAYERSAKLLGRVKALETLLSDQSAITC